MRRILNYTVIAAAFAILGSLALGNGTGSTPKTEYWDILDTLHSPEIVADSTTADEDTINFDFNRKFEYNCDAVFFVRLDTIETATQDVGNEEINVFENPFLSVNEDFWATPSNASITLGETAVKVELDPMDGVRPRIQIILPDSGNVYILKVRVVFKPL